MGGKYLYLLEPTPELWTIVLRHRTQILYVADISMIVFQLELKPGCFVLESGTGTGSLTTSLARSVAPTGKVLTFEFNEMRVNMARMDFARTGIQHIVTVGHKNIEEEGFPDEYKNKIDAVFLDLPRPWKVVESAAACLKQNRMLCSFSPCIEQVQRTCEQLNLHGFRDLQTMEIILREYQVAKEIHECALDILYDQGCSECENDNEKEVGLEEVPNRKRQRSSIMIEDILSPNNRGTFKGIVSKPLPQGKGHTGYLTFARKANSVSTSL